MNSVDARFLFDFGSPNAYFVHKVLPAVEARSGARFDYVPVLLGGLFKLSGNRSPMETYAGVANRRTYDMLEIERFVAKHGLDRFRMNPHFPVNTLQIMRGAIAAERLGCKAPYIDAMFAAMWERGLDMAQPDVIAGVLAEAGLDVAAIVAGSQDADVKAKLMANTQAAFAQGAFGAPTLFVGSEMFFGKDRLAEVEAEIARQMRA